MSRWSTSACRRGWCFGYLRRTSGTPVSASWSASVSTPRSLPVGVSGSGCSIWRRARHSGRPRSSMTEITRHSARLPLRTMTGPRSSRTRSGCASSGTAAALGDRSVAVLDEALTAAATAGVTVSCDLNYRAALWGDRSPAIVMEPLMDRVDVLIGNEEDTERVFGIKASRADVVAGHVDADAYAPVADELVRRFRLRLVATTLRGSRSASSNTWAAIVSNGAGTGSAGRTRSSRSSTASERAMPSPVA